MQQMIIVWNPRSLLLFPLQLVNSYPRSFLPALSLSLSVLLFLQLISLFLCFVLSDWRRLEITITPNITRSLRGDTNTPSVAPRARACVCVYVGALVCVKWGLSGWPLAHFSHFFPLQVFKRSFFFLSRDRQPAFKNHRLPRRRNLTFTL